MNIKKPYHLEKNETGMFDLILVESRDATK